MLMDDELKALLAQLVTKLDTVAAVQAEHGAKLVQLQSDVTDIKAVVGSNYLGLKGRIDQVGDMLMDHVSDYHRPEDRRRA